MITELQQIESDINRLAAIKKAQAARKSFFNFAKYVIGYNGKPNQLILPHVHGEMCQAIQYALKDITDLAAPKLGEGEEKPFYWTLSNYLQVNDMSHNKPSATQPPMPPLSVSGSSGEVPYQNHAVVKNSPSGSDHGNMATKEPLTDNSLPDTLEKSGQLNMPAAEIVPDDSSLSDLQVTKITSPEDFSGFSRLEKNFEGLLSYQDAKKKQLILMPRGSFKSTVGTESLPAYAWLINSNLRVHISSETFAKAKLYAGAVKLQMEQNENYREMYKTVWGVYPDAKKDKWNFEEFNVAGKSSITRETSMSCGSPDVPRVGMHYDIIIIDDLIGQTNITDGGLETATNYYKGLLSVLEPGGVLIVIGTRWHHRDTYAYIIEHEDEFNQIIKAAHNPDGTLLFPERLDDEFLRNQRKSQGSRMYAAQYENRIVSDEDAEFKADNFIHDDIDPDDPKNPLNVFMSIDPVPPGSEERNDPDYFAIAVGGLDAQGKIYYLDGWVGRPNESQAVDKIVEYYDKWKPKKVGFEAVNFQKVYKFVIEKILRERGRSIHIEPITRNNRRDSKNQRIRRLVPYAERGDMIFNKGAGALSVLENQLTEFPRSSHDDLVDAFTDVLDIGYVSKRKDNSEAKEERRKKMRQLLRPRNKITRT